MIDLKEGAHILHLNSFTIVTKWTSNTFEKYINENLEKWFV